MLKYLLLFSIFRIQINAFVFQSQRIVLMRKIAFNVWETPWKFYEFGAFGRIKCWWCENKKIVSDGIIKKYFWNFNLFIIFWTLNHNFFLLICKLEKYEVLKCRFEPYNLFYWFYSNFYLPKSLTRNLDLLKLELVNSHIWKLNSARTRRKLLNESIKIIHKYLKKLWFCLFNIFDIKSHIA